MFNGKTLCRQYKKRFGFKIAKVGGKQIVCCAREKVPLNYKGCPFNKPEHGDVLDPYEKPLNNKNGAVADSV